MSVFFFVQQPDPPVNVSPALLLRVRRLLQILIDREVVGRFPLSATSWEVWDFGLELGS
jgi:hypothetical protein